MVKTPDVIAITGPTASGKTEAAIWLATHFGSEIISCDAMQVYVGMDIGTAKPAWRNRLSPLHHMLDVALPSENYSVARYQREARRCLAGAKKRRTPVLVCGGTPLYLTALLYDIWIPPQPSAERMRKELLSLAEKKPEELFAELRRVDPAAADIIDPRNRRRLVRAVELYRLTGVRYSELHRRWQQRKPLPGVRLFCLMRERRELYERIEKRVERMLAAGLVEEVRLLQKKYRLSKTARQALGYREILAWLAGEMSYAQAVAEIKKRTRRYAKRQLSWFRGDDYIEKVDVTGLSGQEAGEKLLELL